MQVLVQGNLSSFSLINSIAGTETPKFFRVWRRVSLCKSQPGGRVGHPNFGKVQSRCNFADNFGVLGP